MSHGACRCEAQSHWGISTTLADLLTPLLAGREALFLLKHLTATGLFPERSGLHIFLRPLSPYGFAVKTKQFHRYDATGWLDFYRRGLRYILDVNKAGRHFPEFYSALILRRMLTDRPIGYVDLRSPAVIGLGALVYNYDGRVFASDEGRMLSEMGDNTFELGHVDGDSYRSLILSQASPCAL
jgi:hypothetical protein